MPLFNDFFLSPDEYFDNIPIFWNFQDISLRVMLIEFLRTWNNPQHIAWGESHCPEMVDHALNHSKNLFIISNRLFHDNDNLIDQLNDAEKACFVLSLYLHDIGMSKMLFTPKKDNLEEINRFLTQYAYPGENLQYNSSNFLSSITLPDLGCITSGWIRHHHALLSKYLVKNNTRTIHFGADTHEDLREIIGNICLNHSSKVRLSDTSAKGKFYTIPPVDSKNSGKGEVTINSKKYQINVLFLSALLRFVDGCDQTYQRLISSIKAEQFVERNRSERDYLVAEMIQMMDPGDANILSKLSESFDIIESSPDDSHFFSSVDHLKSKYPNYSRYLDEFTHICHYRRNMDYKKSVMDIFFHEGKIVLVLSDDYFPPDILRVKADILKELADVKSILKFPPNDIRDIGIPTGINQQYDTNSFIEETGNCSHYDIPVYEPYQRIRDGYDGITYIAQKLHEAYVSAERVKGNKISNNPQMHLWNRIDQRYRKANIRHGEDIFEYLAMINAYYVMKNNSDKLFEFTPEELEMLSKIEHERWQKEKEEEGWTYGKERDEKNLIHPCILDWDELSEEAKEKDRNVIRNIPIVLSGMNLTIRRR